MAYTADDLRKMRERGTTRASSSDSKRKYTADDLMAMRGKSAQNETASLYDSYAKQAVSNTPKYRYNSLEQYDTALKESKPKNDFAKRVANAGINALNAISGLGLTGTGATPIKNLPYNKEEMAYNDLKKERNLYAQEHMLDEYQKKYKTNADFVAKSHDRGMKETLDVLDSMRGDTMYSSLYENMTDDEKAMANYLSNISESDPKAFEDYMMNMRASVNKREFDKKVAEKNAYMNADGLKKVGRGAALSAESVGENTLASIGTAGEYLESYLGGWNPDPYGGASGLGNLAMAEREAVSKDMGEVGSFVYNTGMSVVDSAIGARLFGKGYSVLMGTNAFNTSYKDLYERGASKDEILLGSLTAGAAETIFEKISLENLLKPRGIKDIKAFAKAWLEQAGVEASEEFFTEMTNVITDELTQGANSEVSQMIYQMRNEGRPEDEIQKAVANMLAKRVGEAALGGFLSGGAMGGMFIGSQYAQNRRIGRNTDREELSQALENINPESDVAREYRGRDLTNLKDTEVGALVMDAYAQADKDARAKYQNAVRDSLENLGLSEGEVEDYYDAIFAEKPTKVQKLLRENETIKDIMRDVNTRILPEIDESARQNKYDIAKTVSNRQGVAKALKKSDLKVGAVTELNGEEVKVTDVIKDGDKITVVTNKGEADPAQLTLSAKDANLVMIASGMENNTMRKAYLNNYHGQNVAEYTDSFSTAYSYGKNGVTEENLLEDIGQTINLSIEDATNIYQQGASEIKKSSNEVIETSEEIKKIMKGFRKGTFDDSKIDKKKLSASQRGAYALAQLWTDMGINVSLFNDTSEDSENGYYKDGTIYINLSARYTKQNLKFDRGYVINTMAHELTHWMEDTDSEAFKALKTAIFNYYGEEKTNRLVAQEQQRYEKEGKTLSKKAAESEVIARACEDMLSNSDTIERILMGVNADTRNNIVTKIREFIDRLGEFLNKILHGNMSPSEASRMLRENAEVFEQVRQQWIKTFTEAVNKIQEVENAYNDVTEDYTKTKSKQFSLKATAESTDKLMALHNVHQSDLLKTLKLGGFACPSIAIKKAYMPHEGYGDCTVVFTKKTIDPKASAWNNAFSGDAWTATFPKTEKKINAAKRKAIVDKVNNLVGGWENVRTSDLDMDNIADRLNSYESVANAYRNNEDLKYAFLQDTGNGFEMPKKEKAYYNELSNETLRNLVDEIGEDIINEAHETSGWYREHPEQVAKIAKLLDEAYAKEHQKEIEDLEKDKKHISRKDLLNFFQHRFTHEKGEIDFYEFDKIISAMFGLNKRGAVQVRDDAAFKSMLEERVDQEAYEKWVEDLFDGIVEKEGYRNNVDYFTYSGNRRSFEALHYEATIENAVKIMRQQAKQGAGNALFPAQEIWGVATRQYTSIEDMKKDIARLVHQDDEERQELRSKYTSRLVDIAEDIRDKRMDNAYMSMDMAGDAIVDSLRGAKTVSAIDKKLRQWAYLDIKENTAQDVLDLYNDILKMVTDYFEAKPTRAVGLDEIAYVVIPANPIEGLIEALDEYGIPHYDYVKDDNESRTQVVNDYLDDYEDVLFSNKVDTEGNELTEAQQEFFAKSKIRDDNGNLLVVYHGTPSGGFTVFNGAMNYYTADKAYAERYTRGSGSGRRGDNPQMYKGYLNIVKPFTLSDPEAKRIYIDEYIKGGYAQGINPLSSKAEIEQYAQTIDWVEADNLKEFFEEKGYDYDGLILNEGGDLTDNGTVMRGDSYVTFASNQFKSIENKNPTENEDIRYSDKIEGSTTEQKISDILQNKYNIGEKEANNEAKGLREIIRRASNNSGRRSGISSVSDKETVALGITTEFVNFGKIDWRGRKLNYDNEKGAYELASYAMLLRNPAYETSRIFYTKGDAIIANDAYTTRLSDATKISDKATNKDAFDDISKKMSRYGADGFYMMHNHPSGSVKPSKLDVETTKLYGNIKGFRGHIVIDHNKYSLIDKSGTYVTADISDGKAIDYNKRVVDHPLLYSKISNADDVGRIAAAITHSPNYSVVLYASSSAEIRMIEAVHDNFVQSKGFEGYIANNKSKIGASWAFLCTENADVYNKSTLKDLYTRTIFKDVVNYQTFNSYMSDGLNQDPSYAGNGKKLNDTKVYKVSDAESTYYSIKDDGFEEKDSKTLGLTDERIDKLLSGGWYGASAKNYAQAYIAYMSPDDYLKLTTGKDQRDMPNVTDWTKGDSYQAGSGDWDFEKFAKGYDHQPIQLIIDEHEGKVIGHEGRHRMARLKEMGYERVPVLLFDRMTDRTKMPHRYMVLTPQVFNKDIDFYGASDRVPAMWMLPFGQDYADQIKRVFGTNSDADVKFNKKVDAEDLLGRNKRLEKENKALEADVQALKDYIKADSRLSDGKVWNPVNLNALAKNLAGNAKSDIDLKKLRKQLSTAYTYISDQLKNDGSWENIMDECYAVASDIYDDIKNKPTLTKKLIASEIKKAGITADSEIISQVQDVVSEANKDDFLRNLAIEVYHGYWKASALKTSADMANEKQQANIDQLKRLKFEHRKTMDWMLAEQKLADEMHFGKEIAKVVREKEKLKRLVDSVRENRDRKLIELKEFVKNRDEKRKNDAEKRKLITRITDISTDLMKRIERPEKGKTVPAALQQPLLELVRAIDYSSAQLLGRGKNGYTPTQRDARLGDLINRVSIAVNTIKEQNADSNDAFALAGLSLSPEYGEMLQKIADNINQIESATDLGREYTLQLMTTEDLQVLSDMLTDLKTNINNLNRAMTRENAHSVDYIGEAILKHRDGVGARNINKITQPIAKFMSIMNKTPYYFFKHLGQGGDEAFSFLMDGWDKYAFLAKHISNFTKELYKPEQVQKWDSTLHTFTITLPQTFEEMAEGKQETRDLTLSESQLMSLYCMTKRPQALKHILDGNGIVIDEIDLKGKLKNIAEQKATVVSQADIAKMIEIVESDSEMKRVADAIQKFMSTESAKWINEIYFKLHGTYLALEDNYFPISVDQKTMRSEAKEKNQSLYSLLNQSWTKPLQPNAKNQVIIANIFDVFTDHATSTAKYNALALPVLDVIKVWNYAEINERGNEGKKEINNVKMAIADMMGNEGNQYISHLLHDINGDSESGRYDDLMMKWVKKSKLAKVAANLQTALLQPLSYIRGAYSMSPKYLSKALLMSPKEVKKYIDKTFDSVGVAIWKDMGFYDTNLTASLAKIVRNSETIVDKAVDATLKPAEWMDKVTWGYLYKAVELEIKDKYSTLTGEAFNSKMHDRLREVLYGTQVFDSTLSRTDMMRSKSTFVKVATAFGSEPILHINMLMDAVTEFWYEKKRTNTKNAMIQYGRNLTRAGLVYLVSAIIESTLRAVIGKYKKYDDEDDEEFEGLAEDIYKRTLEELNPLTKLPFTKDIMSIANGYQHKDMNYEFVSSTINAWKDMLKAINNREATFNTIVKIFDAASLWTGMPFANALKEFKALWNNLIGRFTGWMIK